jgi:AraC-like DNA-binding protein/mannose-6-phosphate isomerase-like protein (cupin superfamily)
MSSSQIHGEILRTRTVEGATLAESTYTAGSHLGMHAHANTYFCLVLAGEYQEVSGRRSYLCHPGSLVVHPAGEQHRNRFDGRPVRCFNLELANSSSSLFQKLRLTSAVHDGGPSIFALTRIYREFLRPDTAADLIIQGLVLELLGECLRQQSGKAADTLPDSARQCRDLLCARFRERLSIIEIAKCVDVHPVHLCRAFHACYGQTIGEFVRELRMRWASEQLALAKRSLANVAVEAGFCDQSHFNRTFKRFTGMAPGQYRSRITRR